MAAFKFFIETGVLVEPRAIKNNEFYREYWRKWPLECHSFENDEFTGNIEENGHFRA